MAHRLYTSIATERGARGYIFDPDVKWVAVHKARFPAVAVFTDDDVVVFDNRNAGDDPEKLKSVLEKIEAFLASRSE